MSYIQGQWRVGDAGYTVFGPKNGTTTPEVIATVKRPANAQLIAAAPELLDHLKALAGAFPFGEDVELNGGDLIDYFNDRMPLIRAVIRKAEGKTP